MTAAIPSADTITANKLVFLDWLAERTDLDATDFRMMHVIVRRLLGLEEGKPYFNGWSTVGVLASALGIHKRNVQRSMRRLEALGLLYCTIQRGRGGRVYLHVPGIDGAAERLKLRPLRDRTADDDAPSKTRRSRHVYDGENAALASSKTRRSRHVNPVEDPVERTMTSGEGARGTAGEPQAAARAVFEHDGDGGPSAQEGLRQEAAHQDGGTHARWRLIARLDGLARKVGRTIDAAFLAHVGEDIVQRWLRMQRENRDAALVEEVVRLLADFLEIDPVTLGKAVATKAEKGPRPRTPPPRRPGRPLRTDSAFGHAGDSLSRRHASTGLLGPADDDSAPARKAPTFTAAEIRASGARLGIGPKEVRL